MTLTFTISENACVEIRACHNRVTVVGWDEAHTVAVEGTARQDGDTIFVENVSKAMLRVPRAATVTIADCEADVRVDDLTGRVELTGIGGDVALRHLRGETIVRDVDGQVAAKGVATLKGEGKWEGDVALRDARSVAIEEIEGDASLSDVDTAILHTLRGDLVARQVKSLYGKGTWEGSVTLRGVESVSIAEIEGDASLGDVGAVTIETLEGDLSAQGVRDALTLDEVKGDVSLREVAAAVTIERVGGDFVMAGARQAVTVEDVEGDAVVSFETVAALSLRADGDVVIHLPEEANAEIVLDAPRGDLVARAGIKVLEEDESHLRGTLGNSGVKIQAESTRGDVIVRRAGTRARDEVEPFAQFARLGHEIAAEVRQSVRQSLGDAASLHTRGKRHWGVHVQRHRRHRYDEPTEPRAEPRGPVAGSPERKAILDAIARGEISVDDAIKALTSE